jgi:quinol monooxygenase YgiN
MPTTTRIRSAGPGAGELFDDAQTLEARAVSELQGIARFKIHEGKLEEFKRLSAQAREVVRTKDTGTLQYDIYFNEDQSECIVLERFRDSEALIEHAANLGDDFMEAILATVSVVHGELLGEPNAELRARLADSEVPQLFTPYQSM